MACPLIYAPVCLENGVTVGNECAAKCENSTIMCKGECPCKSSMPSKAIDEDMPYQCLAEPDPGPCRAFFQRFAYNYTSGKCEPFVFGGCQGNYNNFETMEECKNVCVEPSTSYCLLRLLFALFIWFGYHLYHTQSRCGVASRSALANLSAKTI